MCERLANNLAFYNSVSIQVFSEQLKYFAGGKLCKNLAFGTVEKFVFDHLSRKFEISGDGKLMQTSFATSGCD